MHVTLVNANYSLFSIYYAVCLCDISHSYCEHCLYCLIKMALISLTNGREQ